MDKEKLTQGQIENGGVLLQALDSANIPVNSALWFKFPEPLNWQFVIASTLVDAEGSNSVKATVQAVLTQAPACREISSSQVTVMSPNSELIQRLRTAINTGPASISGIRFTNNVINGLVIEDALLYRVS
jgi:hypothetical protein